MKEITVLHVENGQPLSASINPEVAHKEADKMRKAGLEISITTVSVLDSEPTMPSGQRMINALASVVENNKTETLSVLFVLAWILVVGLVL